MAILVGYNFYSSYATTSANQKSISYTALVNKVQSKEISRIIINNTAVKAYAGDNTVYVATVLANDQTFINQLKANNVEIIVAKPETSSGLGSLLFIGVAIFFIILIIRSLRGGGDNQSSGGGGGGMGSPFSFGKSKAKFIAPKDINVSFADVAGIEEAKHEVLEIVDFLKNPEKFNKVGAKIPKGCLLYGLPGSGKTLLAKAIAGEAKVAFFSISGSDFVEMFVGVGASRVRDLFTQAKKQAPCIIFIDEIDAVGRQRGVGVGGGNDEREQTLNQLLVEMDGFTTNQGVIVIAASNRKDVLDSALLRPGRFDRQVYVPLPDLIGRERILSIYLAKVPVDNSVDVHVLARGSTGFSGADLANLVNEAALMAATAGDSILTMMHFEQARDKILMGSERKTSKMTEKDRKLTAYHEAGHALVAFKVPDYYPVHKVTIIPRGMSLGVTSFLPEKDEYNRSYTQLISQLAVLFGGRLSEELIFGKEHITTGASMDIQMATNTAKRMVTEWGFSDKVGRLRYVDENSSMFGSYSKAISDETAKEVEQEMRALIENAEKTAREILTTYAKAHHDLANALLEYETLSGAEAKMLCLEGVSIKEIREQNLLGKTTVADDTSNKASSIPQVD